MGIKLTNRYSLPPGYAVSKYLNSAANPTSRYLPNNGFTSKSPYAPNVGTAQRILLTFSGVPADASTIIVADIDGTGAIIAKTFTFTYGGSPGAGIIPLVGGGGTTIQATAATLLAFQQQLLSWVETSISNVSFWITRNIVGITSAAISGSQATISPSAVSGAAVALTVLPVRFGTLGSYCPGE